MRPAYPQRPKVSLSGGKITPRMPGKFHAPACRACSRAGRALEPRAGDPAQGSHLAGRRRKVGRKFTIPSWTAQRWLMRWRSRRMFFPARLYRDGGGGRKPAGFSTWCCRKSRIFQSREKELRGESFPPRCFYPAILAFLAVFRAGLSARILYSEIHARLQGFGRQAPAHHAGDHRYQRRVAELWPVRPGGDSHRRDFLPYVGQFRRGANDNGKA